MYTTHHFKPLVQQKVKPLHAAKLALRAIPPTNDINTRWLSTGGYPLKLRAILFCSNGLANKKLALCTSTKKLWLKNDIFQKCKVQKSQSNILKNFTGIRPTLCYVMSYPGTCCFKYLYLMMNIILLLKSIKFKYPYLKLFPESTMKIKKQYNFY